MQIRTQMNFTSKLFKKWTNSTAQIFAFIINKCSAFNCGNSRNRPNHQKLLKLCCYFSNVHFLPSVKSFPSSLCQNWRCSSQTRTCSGWCEVLCKPRSLSAAERRCHWAAFLEIASHTSVVFFYLRDCMFLFVFFSTSETACSLDTFTALYLSPEQKITWAFHCPLSIPLL